MQQLLQSTVMHHREEFSITVLDKDCGIRLDTAIAFHVPSCSRNFASDLIKNNIVKVNGDDKKPGYRLKLGDKITGYIPLPEPVSFDPERIDLDIIYEDNDIVVLNKDAGMVVHPAPGHFTGTLVNALLYHCPDIKGVGGISRPGIVHRLDKDTTGIMVVAKNYTSLLKLSKCFKDRNIKKRYLALVYGDVTPCEGVINLPIGRHPVNRKKMATIGSNLRPAKTCWKVKKKFNGITLLELDLKTGRTHQIRVHCASINHPIIGDPLYCKRRIDKHFQGSLLSFLKNITTQMLHSWQIEFSHPILQKNFFFEAPIPNNMQNLLELLQNA